MDMGAPSPAYNRLQALIEAAGGSPLPPLQALGLLRRIKHLPASDLARLAYRALTGVEPDPDAPTPATEVLPGFPAFASEVLQRAIGGPDERRPDVPGLLVVLETVPPEDWPTSDLPPVTVSRRAPEPEPAPEPDPTPEPEPTPEPAAEVDPEPEPEPEPLEEEPEPEAEDPRTLRARERAEFRSLLAPSREVPRFRTAGDIAAEAGDDTDTDPDAPAGARDFHDLVAAQHEVPRFDPIEPADDVTVRPLHEATEPEAADEPEVVEDESPADESDETEPAEEPADEPESVEDEPEEPAEEPRARPALPRATEVTGPAEQRHTMILVAVLGVLLLLAALYTTRDDGDAGGRGGDRDQGASLVLSQPAPESSPRS